MNPILTVNHAVAAALAAFTVDTVAIVYSGKPGCQCGCRGNYRYATRFVEWASADRGRAVTAKEINDVQVRRVLNALLAAESPEELDFAKDGSNVAREVAGHKYVAYLAKN